jgi:hypothetical protein
MKRKKRKEKSSRHELDPDMIPHIHSFILHLFLSDKVRNIDARCIRMLTLNACAHNNADAGNYLDHYDTTSHASPFLAGQKIDHDFRCHL